MSQPDYVIAGAGIVGLSLALELHLRGASVTVLEAGTALKQTSAAAAGMLAVDDPANPPALHALSALSARLYPEFLDRLHDLGGARVPFQTTATIEACEPSEAFAPSHELVPQLAADAPPFRLRDERSVDPRQLGAALHQAVTAAGIDLREFTALTRVAMQPGGVRVTTTQGEVSGGMLIDCMAAWSPAPIRPRKGQMLAVQMPAGLDLGIVVRSEHVYIVPRTAGPDAGRAVIGATLEDAGFDLTVHPKDILSLHAHAVKLLPALEAAAGFLSPGPACGPPRLTACPCWARCPASRAMCLPTATSATASCWPRPPRTCWCRCWRAKRRPLISVPFSLTGLPSHNLAQLTICRTSQSRTLRPLFAQPP